MNIDSSLYLRLLAEIKSISNQDLTYANVTNSATVTNLPRSFLEFPLNLSKISIDDIKLFLSSCIENFSSSGFSRNLFQSNEKNYFSNLILYTHKILSEVLSDANPANHAFHSNGIQLIRFLTFCSYDNIPDGFFTNDLLCIAMMCFLLEALIFCGWCPDTFEGLAKRSAHEYCLKLKKSLHFQDFQSIDIIYGYICCAWILAQKTEGLRVNESFLMPNRQSFTFNINNLNATYMTQKASQSSPFYIISKQQRQLPHPFINPVYDGLVGLNFFLNNEQVKPEELIDYSEITRIKKNGHQFVYKCNTSKINELLWIVVFLTYKKTFYRTDILKFPGNVENINIKAELNIECKIEVKQMERNVFKGIGAENQIIKFLETDFMFFLQPPKNKEVISFLSQEKQFSESSTIKIVTTWANGKEIKDIDRTYLLGIYD
jgi:hypothetical protein